MRPVGRLAFYLVLPGLLLYLRRSQRSRVVLFHEGRILVIRNWLGNGKWSLPGGGLHSKEVIIDGALREVREEVGLRLAPEDLRFLATETYSDGPIRFLCHYLSGELTDAPTLRLQRPEISGAAWLSPDEITTANANADVRRGLVLCGHASSDLLQ